MEKVLYVSLVLLAGTAAGFAHQALFGVLHLSREANFFLSFGLAVALGFASFVEERLLWRGYFGFTPSAYRNIFEYRRLAPAPLLTGASSPGW